MERKITAKEFLEFKVECRKWIDRLGLRSWTITFVQEPHKCMLGACSWSYADRCATLYLNTKYTSRYIDIKAVALHECLELLMSPMQDLAEDRVWSKDEWIKERHIVIRTLENVLSA